MTQHAKTGSLVAHRLKQKKAKRSAIWFVLPWVKILKNHSQNYFFTIVTVASIFGILTLSFQTNLSYSVGQIQSQSASFTESLAELISADIQEIPEQLAALENKVLSDLQPVLSFSGLEEPVRGDFAKAKYLAVQWLEAIEPLREYQLTVKGLVNLKQEKKTFTDDLKVFLNKLETKLLPDTKAVWQEFSPYVFLAKVAGYEKIQNLESLVQNLMNLSDMLLQHQQSILDMLGATKKQRLVIFNQNIGEARPTGGFIGSYISIDVMQGRININESNSIYHPDNSIEEKLYMHPATAFYGWFDNTDISKDHGIRNVNFLPCFSETAKILYDGFQMSPHGYPIDLMLFITPQLLLDVLGPDYSFEVTGVGQLSSNNIMDEIERLTALEYKDPTNPKKDLQQILESLLREIPKIIRQKSGIDWLEMILTSILSRDLQLWSSHSDLQSFFEGSGITNLAMCNRSTIPEVGFLLGNISADKRGLITENQFNIYTEEQLTGTLVRVKYKQILPVQPELQRGFAGERSFTFAGLQLPSEAQNLSVSSPQAIYTSFTKPYYQELFRDSTNQELTKLPEISYIVRSGQNLYDEKGNPPGFVYEHSNGSKVLGIYMHDADRVSEVEFSFVLPKSIDVFKFYGQPGLQKPSLGLGQGVEFYEEGGHSAFISDYYQIHSGIYLKLQS